MKTNLNLYIQTLSIDDLNVSERNAKMHTEEQIEHLKESIQRYGFIDPIGIWSDKNIIVEGAGRYRALQDLGYTDVPCIRLDHLTDQERREYSIAHNKINMETEFDLDLLNIELKELDLEFLFDGIDGIDEDLEDIDDTKLPTVKLEYITVGKTKIPITEEERDALLLRLSEYVDQNGVSFGFVSVLLDDKN